MPYGLRSADQITLEVLAGKLQVKDASLDSGKLAAAQRVTITADDFTIEHHNKPVVMLDGGMFGSHTSSTTQAIADGAVDGQLLTILMSNCTYSWIIIKNGARTRLTGDWKSRFGIDNSDYLEFLEVVWDANNSLWVERRRGATYNANASGYGAMAFGQDVTASGEQAFAGGYYCTASGKRSLAMGHNCNAAADYAVALGYGAYAPGERSFASGANVTASGYGAYAVGVSGSAAGYAGYSAGYSCGADGPYSHAIGRSAKASLDSQFAHSSRYRTARGDAQFTRFVMKATTTDANPSEVTTPSRFTLDDNKVYGLRISVTATKDDLSANAFFDRRLLIKKQSSGADVTKIAESTISDLGSNAGAPPAGWGVSFTEDDVNDSLKIEVTGQAAATIYWLVVVEAFEVA